MKPILLSLLITFSMTTEISQAQDPLPYSSIPDSPSSFTAGNVTGRMIDGLGFRYYWATEGLTESDLQHKPSQDARSLMETLEHIYRLTLVMVNVPQNIVNEGSADYSLLEFEELRSKSLRNMKYASDLLKGSTNSEVETYQVVFKRGDNQHPYPMWNLINGQISDAIWHTGQVVLMRRAAGNPINPKVNVFTGKLNK
ncbi:MAG: hypothetical protein DHS20C17_11290 [Cyclobacteriaceae bacterium]|nr:MAG: hypothetical protein DHS20C17_11290 [Cyclobacteriaceae bacterium]